MNPIEYIQQYTLHIQTAASLLKRLYIKSFPLPSMEEVNKVKQDLLSIQPADITAKIVWEENYKSKERFIVDALKPYLEIDGGHFCVKIDGEVYDCFDNMYLKLQEYTKNMDEPTAQKYIEDYTEIISGLSWIIHDTTNAMRNDVNYMFDKKIFESRNKFDNDTSTGVTAPEDLKLPIELDTDRARKCFGRALERGWMIATPTGYKWLFGGNRGQARLGYFCGKVYQKPIPITQLEKLFDVRNLSASITQSEYEATRADVKRWRAEIDD